MLINRRKFTILIILLIFTLYILHFTLDKVPVLAQAPTCSTGTNSIRLNAGFLSVANPNLEGNFSFLSGSTPLCIIDKTATIPQFSLLNYDDLKSFYFTQSKLAFPQKKTYTANLNHTGISFGIAMLPANTTGLSLVQGTVTIAGAIAPATPHPAVFFIDGDLIIQNTGIPYTGGLVFVVKGNVYVDQSVGGSSQPINAFIITNGQFCSAAITSTPPSCLPTGTTAQQLIINGSVISLDAGKTPQFARSLSNNTEPAELINYQPKYLVITRDVFARELSIWSEIE